MFISNHSFSQQKWPSSLLWRISGNGLEKPSYLFGTMHLQDKRLFNFGDSLYKFLEKADGFAMEINFQEYVDTLFRRSIEEEEKQFYGEEETVEIDSEEMQKAADSILKTLGISKKKLSKDQLKKIRNYRVSKLIKHEEMPTIVDAYLYGLAQRQSKWVGAVEDVTDQMDFKNEMGGELDPDEIFQSEDKLRYSLEKMIGIYLSQDLQSIEDYSYKFSDKDFRNRFLIQRNIKMAHRMDSLAAIRSMFFAVGAAHLPGDSGVIRFLRKKGFTVEPVFSSKKIAAETYARKLSAIEWVKVTDENKLYTLEMPGMPSDYDMYREMFRMKMFFDITTMTFYMSGSSISSVSSDKELGDALKTIVAEMSEGKGKISRKKSFRHEGIRGVEGVFENKDGFYRIRLLQKDKVVFMLFVGSHKKENLSTKDVMRFFESFKPLEIKQNDWVKFSLPEKAFSVDLPGIPKRNPEFEKQDEGTNWKFSVYDHADIVNGNYFIVQVRDLEEGYFLDGDSSFFAEVKSNLSEKLDRIERDEVAMHQGFPAFHYSGISNVDQVRYQTYNVIRGNRIYSLMVISTIHAETSMGEDFFRSFHLEAYPEREWEKQVSPDGDFYTMAPYPFRRVEEENEADAELPATGEKQEMFISFDPEKVISYQVVKEPLPAHYWAESDSSFFGERTGYYRYFFDSIIFKKDVFNGTVMGREVIIKMPDNNNLKKVRCLLNADTLYTLIAFIPEQYINDEGHNLFFDEFRLANEIPTGIFSSKSAMLLEELKTKDSADFESAKALFNKVEFQESDLPLLHNALMEVYLDNEDDFSNISNSIAMTIADFGDPSTIDFIRNNYAKLVGEREVKKHSFLYLLSILKTSHSFELLKNLMLEYPLPAGNITNLRYSLEDSLELTHSLYPEILSLSNDSLFREILVSVTDRMLDSNRISMETVLPYKEHFLDHAKERIRTFNESAGMWWRIMDWIYFTAKFNDEEGNAVLNKFLKLETPGIQSLALVLLAKNGQPADQAIMERIASDVSTRLGLYEELKELNLESLFPSRWATQRSLAESEVYVYASESYIVTGVEFAGEKNAKFQGEKQKFYLFRVIVEGNDEKETYLGVAGPFSRSKEIILYSDATGVYWDELLNKSRIDDQLEIYLSQVEAYLRMYGGGY